MNVFAVVIGVAAVFALLIFQDWFFGRDDSGFPTTRKRRR